MLAYLILLFSDIFFIVFKLHLYKLLIQLQFLVLKSAQFLELISFMLSFFYLLFQFSYFLLVRLSNSINLML